MKLGASGEPVRYSLNPPFAIGRERLGPFTFMDILFWFLLLLLLFRVPPFSFFFLLLVKKKRNERTRVINIEINGKKSRRVQSLKGVSKDLTLASEYFLGCVGKDLDGECNQTRKDFVHTSETPRKKIILSIRDG